MINRRVFSKLAAISPFAAAASATGDVATGVKTASSIGEISAGKITGSAIEDEYVSLSTKRVVMNNHSTAAGFIKRGLITREQVKDALRSNSAKIQVGLLDPDLAAMKSFSLVTKYRLQFERDLEARTARKLDETEPDLHNLLINVAKKFNIVDE